MQKSINLLSSAFDQLQRGNVQQAQRIISQQQDLDDTHRSMIINAIQEFYLDLKAPTALTAPTAPKAPKVPKAPKASKAPKAPKALTAPKASKAPKAPKALTAPKPKAKKGIKLSKAVSARKTNRGIKIATKTPKGPKPQPNSVISAFLRQQFQKQTQQRQRLRKANQIIGNALEGEWKIKKITPNGSCMFSAIAFYLKDQSAARLRQQAVEQVSAQWERFGGLHEDQYHDLEDYIEKMSKRSTYGDMPELLVLAEAYNLCVIVVNEDDDNITLLNSTAPNIIILYLSGRDSVPHYDVILFD